MNEEIRPVAGSGNRVADWDGGPFVGAKAALFIGDRLLTLLRDDKPTIAWPACWDLVGGEREPGESPIETLIRETREEVGLDIAARPLLWARPMPAWQGPDLRTWFFVLRLPRTAVRDLLFGDEGGAWALVTPERFMTMPDTIPVLIERMTVWLDDTGGIAPP